MLAQDATMTGVSVSVLGALLALLALAGGMFYVLVWRETSARRSVALAEWARESGFYSNPLARLRPPHPLDEFSRPVRVGTCLVSKECTAVDFLAEALETSVAGISAAAASAAATPGTVSPASISDVTRSLRRWRHVLLWPLDQAWESVGLRPVDAEDSIVDLLPLPSQAARFGAERFVIFSNDRRAAASIATGSLRVLLPPDIGLLLHGKHLLLDFSSRPFDGIEIDRMILIAKQLASRLNLGR